ncbi:hypothetical protein [Lentzea sp.]|uniref:hypothetical protein n=1 Tax=Lentzea sp. TaxID=56099 RepID=UPI002ED2FE2F
MSRDQVVGPSAAEAALSPVHAPRPEMPDTVLGHAEAVPRTYLPGPDLREEAAA